MWRHDWRDPEEKFTFAVCAVALVIVGMVSRVPLIRGTIVHALQEDRHRHSCVLWLYIRRETGNDQRGCAIDRRRRRDCVSFLSGSADSAKHALPAFGNS